MPSKRMRVFAGPNGSGKTTIINKLLSSNIHLGIYVNADDIEIQLKNKQSLPFNPYSLQITETALQDFFKVSTFSPVKRNESDLWEKLSVKENVLYIDAAVDSYLAADLAEFIRQMLLENGISFTYETVMSHLSKIQFMQKARDKGYRVYLYFIATEDPDINVSRVNVRVAQNGHAVKEDVVRRRYLKSLENLKSAIKNTNRAYIFDNSGIASLLIAEITDGYKVDVIDTDKVPNWFVKYLIVE